MPATNATIALPSTTGYPAIQGILDNALQFRGTPLAMLSLTKVMKGAAAPWDLVDWCHRAHAQATTGRTPTTGPPLGLTEGSYYVVALHCRLGR